jgi:integral membrane protein
MAATIPAFRRIAVAEATTFLILLTFSYLKNFQDGSDSAVTIFGAIHGVLFLAYLISALGLREDEGWSGKTLGLVLLGAVLPFGGYVVDRRLA